MGVYTCSAVDLRLLDMCRMVPDCTSLSAVDMNAGNNMSR